MDAAGIAGIDAAAEEIDGLDRAARAGQEAMNRHDLADDGESGFLLGFAPRDRGGRFVLIDDPGDDLKLPGGKAGKMRGEAKLLYEDEDVALRVIEQDGRRIVAQKDLARELGAPAAGVETMTQPEVVDAKIASIDRLALADVDRVLVQ